MLLTTTELVMGKEYDVLGFLKKVPLFKAKTLAKILARV